MKRARVLKARRSTKGVNPTLIDRLMNERGLSNAGLARLIEAQRGRGLVSEASVSLWRRGHRRPGPENLFAIAAALNVEPQALLAAS